MARGGGTKLHPKREAKPSATCPKHPDKEWRKLVKAAWDDGWWKKDSRKTMTEANVLLTLAMEDPMSFEVLDANSDDVLEAVQKHASDVALGPTISLDMKQVAILVRFDVAATSEAMAYRKIASVLGAIEKNTDLVFTRSASSVEASDGELVAAGP